MRRPQQIGPQLEGGVLVNRASTLEISLHTLALQLRVATSSAILLVLVLPAMVARSASPPEAAQPRRVQLKHDEQAGRLHILIDGREALVYRYGADVDLPHYYPVRSPSGKSMTVEHPQPYPHHRSFWFADKVRLAGQRAVNFYGAWYTSADRENPHAPFRDHIRHVAFLEPAGRADQPIVRARLIWEMDSDRPVLDELRTMRVVPLNDGEYFLDLVFTVTASYGDVAFVSDAVHYAWPYVRMSTAFSVDRGGTITSSTGGKNQKGTHNKVAAWIDYTNTVDGQTEGLAILSHPSNEHPHRWLTRDYGCFGPRRPDAKSGKPFTLRRGESLSTRVGVLVHRGDVVGGKVAERYAAYAEGKL